MVNLGSRPILAQVGLQLPDVGGFEEASQKAEAADAALSRYEPLLRGSFDGGLEREQR